MNNLLDSPKDAPAGDAVQQSEHALRALADALPQLAWIADQDGAFVWYNEHWYDYTGATPEQMAGDGWQQCYAPDCLLPLQRRWQQSLSQGTPFEMEVPIRGADGHFRWFLSRANPVRDAGGRLLRWFGTSTDVDQVKRVQETLRAVASDNARLYKAAQQAAKEREQLLDSERSARAEAERTSQMKDEFLATLSHELRTPLTAILGWAQVLRRGSRDQADLNRGLQTIERNARAQAQLIEDLLYMSSITSGKVQLDMQTLAPLAVVSAAIDTVRPAAEARQIRIERRFEPMPGLVWGDASRLQQVVWNLLTNAVKFTPRGGTVTVSLARAGDQVEISVGDDGIGIAPSFLPHVFERFRQADASITRRHGGLGLGLSIVKHLVEQHGGTVSASSPGEGHGACFTVRLPRSLRTELADGQSAPSLADGPGRAHDLSGMQVLVVDDEADARELIKRILNECNADVLTAATATEALSLLQHTRPDLMVSDLGMPEVDGYGLLDRIRAMGPARGGDLPAIALTAFARSEDRVKALSSGFLTHISKPVEPNELIAKVAAMGGPHRHA